MHFLFAVNFGHLFHLFLVLGAELAAGRTLLTSPEVALDSDTQSIISDLEEALTKFRSRINAVRLTSTKPSILHTGHVGLI